MSSLVAVVGDGRPVVRRSGRRCVNFLSDSGATTKVRAEERANDSGDINARLSLPMGVIDGVLLLVSSKNPRGRILTPDVGVEAM